MSSLMQTIKFRNNAWEIRSEAGKTEEQLLAFKVPSTSTARKASKAVHWEVQLK